MNRKIPVALAFLMIAVVDGASRAAPLPAGGALEPVPEEGSPYSGSNTNRPELVSAVVPKSPGGYSGSVRSVVVTNDASSPLDGLTFSYWVTSTIGSSSPGVTRVAVPGYEGFATDVSHLQRSDVIPVSADRSADGEVIGFNFAASPAGNGLIVPGTNTQNLLVQTDATEFRQATASLYAGATLLGTATVYVPVPEPMSHGVLLTAAALLLRRRARMGLPTPFK